MTEQVRKIKEQLEPGDYKLIAELAGVHRETVSHTMRGEYKANTPAGRTIIHVAERIIQTRQDTKMAIAQEAKEVKISTSKGNRKNV
ncbi:MAG: hypothetical protein EP346_06850 [Bacteroidetes bacterium]|nr:MAG: hypothetical protein EP346_06850 [Bacteroidota bacterium]